MNMAYRILLSILILTLVIPPMHSANLIPDANNPISISYPSGGKIGDALTVIKLSFTFPKSVTFLSGMTQILSSGLFYHQYIGVGFFLQETLQSLFTNAAQFKCKAKSEGADIMMSSQVSIGITGQHIAYCRLDDLINEILPGSAIDLSITFMENIGGFVKNGVKTISLFTSSSTEDDRYVLDSMPVFTTFAIHPLITAAAIGNELSLSYSSIGNKMINSPMKFEGKVTFNQWSVVSDYVFALNYDPNCFIAGNVVVAISKGGANIGSTLKDFELNANYKSSAAEINTYIEALPIEIVTVTFEGIKTISLPLTNCFSEMVVYYKNTNNVITRASQTTSVTKASLSLEAFDPSSSDEAKTEYFQSGAYPIKFTFSSKDQTFTNFYLAIKQNNFKGNSRKVTFIPSSCDLKQLTTTTLIADRPNCYPLDHEYASEPNNPDYTNGSGFFVFIKELPKGNNKSIVIWAYFDECGPNGLDIVTIDFMAYAYQSIDKTQFGFKRFENNKIMAESLLDTSMKGKVNCYNNDLGGREANGGHHWSQTGGFDTLRLYREYYDWSIYKVTPPVFTNPMPTPETIFKAPGYIKETTDQLYNNPFLISVREKSYVHMLNSFPMGLDKDKNRKDYRLNIKYSKNFVKRNINDNCFVSWAFDIESGTRSDWAKVPWVNENANWISSKVTAAGANNKAIFPFDMEIDTEAPPTGETTGFTFGSKDEAELTVPAITDSTHPINIYFALADNCHSLQNMSSLITSLYESFQIRIGLYLTTTTDNTRKYDKMMRLIKLFPEGGLFNSIKSSNPDADVFINHFSFQRKGINTYGVCLLELDATKLKNMIQPSATPILEGIFALWLFGAGLIETDYEKASEYPVTNIGSSKAYGLVSPETLGPKNYYKIGSGTNLPPISYLKTLEMAGPYHFFMGSVLLINDFAETLLTDGKNVLIPYYCPTLHTSNSDDNLIKEAQMKFPTVMGTFITGNKNHDGWGHVQAYMGKAANNLIFESVKDIIALTDMKPYFTPVRYGPLQDAKNKIDVYLGRCRESSKVCADVKCSAYILMFHESVFTAADNLLDSPTTPPYQYKLTNLGKFYPYGKSFSGLIFETKTDDPPTMSIVAGFQLNSRKFYKNDQFSSIDKAGYWCTSSSDGQSVFATNFWDNKALSSFDSTTTPDTNLKVTSAKVISSIIYSSDRGGSISFDIDLGLLEQAGSLISFTLDKTASVCGIYGGTAAKSKYLNDCTFIDYTFTCLLKEELKIVKVSCYNVNFDDVKPAQFTIRNLKVFQRNTPDTYDYLVNLVTKANTADNTVTTRFSNPYDPMTIEQIVDDSYANNQGALGKLSFKLDLKRDLPRDATITVSSFEFKKLLLTGFTPKCVISFLPQFPFITSDYTNDITPDEQVLFESCKVDFTAITRIITIKTKNIAFKHEFLMKNIVYMHIWPAVLYDLNGSSYTIDAKVGALDMNYEGRFGKFIAMTPAPLNDYTALTTANVLCYLTGLSVVIPGEKGDYTFTFLLSHNYIRKHLVNELINEVTIYFPHEHYKGTEENILCYQGSILLVCSYSSENVLNIQFKQSINFGKDIEVTISNIRNPVISPSEVINFAYSINKYAFGQNKTRFVLLYGISNLRTKVDFSSVANGGILRFFKLPGLAQGITNTLSREETEHKFRIAIDYISQTIPPVEMSEPKFVIEFPDEYQLYAPLVDPKVVINEFTYDPLKVNPSLQSNIKAIPLIVSTRGNRLLIGLNRTFKVLKTIAYWEITISGITLPKDLSLTDDNHSGAFHIMLINHDSTVYFSSPSNANNHSTKPKKKDQTFRYDQWYKGMSLSYGYGKDSKWYIDITSNTSTLNKLAIQPGRYFKGKFVTKPNERALSAKTKVKLVSDIFKTTEEEYDVVTSIVDGTEFYIGCACDTGTGEYLVSFTVANLEQFAVIMPIKVLVYVDKNAVSKITYDVPTSIPLASSFWLKYYLEEPNFDILSIKWKRKPGMNIYTSIDIPAKSFTIKSNGYSNINSLFSFLYEPTNLQGIDFIVDNPNNCYEFPQKEFNIKIDDTLAHTPIPSTWPLSPPMMTFVTSDVIPSPNIPKNSIKFTYKPTVLPSFLYCILQCSELPIPSIDMITFRTLQEYLTKYPKDTLYKKHYSTYIPITPASSTIDFIFDDLIRGLDYRLICVLESAEAKANRRNVISDMINMPGVGISPPIPINPTKINLSHCVTQEYSTEVIDSVKVQMVDLCQRFLTVNRGYYTNGCVICSDYSTFVRNAGMDLTQSTCEITSRLRILNQRQKLRSFQQVFTEKNIFSICAQQDVNCKTDPMFNGKDFEAQFKDFINSIKTKAGLENNYGLTDIPLVDNTDFETVDSHGIEVSGLFGQVEGFDTSGSLTYSAYYTGHSVLVCHYMIVKSYEWIPSMEEMAACTRSVGLCGGLVIVNGKTQGVKRNLKGMFFSYDTEYTMYLGCKNLNPLSTDSVIISLGTFKTEYQEKFCPDGTTKDYPICIINGNWRGIAYWMMAIILAIIII